jgi:Amt family ammonium transporter
VSNVDLSGPFRLLGANATAERCPFSYATLTTAQAVCSARADCSAVEEQAGFSLCGLDKIFELRGNGSLVLSPGMTSYVKDDPACLGSASAVAGAEAASFPQMTLSTVMMELDGLWYFVGTTFVFLMQTGFTLLEVGFVSVKNTKNILIKNVYTSCLAAVAWLLLGSSISSGDGPFMGRLEMFEMPTLLDYASEQPPRGGEADTGHQLRAAHWLLGWAFACNSASIISGAVAERIKYEAFMLVCFVLISFVYPVVAHWVWSTGGWAVLGAPMGVIDFAGSGVVHLVGGTAALVTSVYLGPRSGRFGPPRGAAAFGNPDNPFGREPPAAGAGSCLPAVVEARDMPRQSTAFQTIGMMLMWIGWYGFNSCATLPVTGANAAVALKTAFNTTM